MINGKCENFYKRKEIKIEIYQYAAKRRRNIILIRYVIYSIMYQKSSRKL